MQHYRNPLRVLILFNTPYLWGMERGVIETFDLLRPRVEPLFLVSRTIDRLKLPLLAELQSRGLPYCFLSDFESWPRIGKPHAWSDVGPLVSAMVRGNRDVLAAARQCDALYVPSVQYLYFGLLAAPLFLATHKPVIYHFHDLVSVPSSKLRLAAALTTHAIHNTLPGRKTVLASNPWFRACQNWVLPYRTVVRLNGPHSPFAGSGAKRHIVFAGRISERKGAHLLIAAFQQIAATYPDVHLHLLGEDGADGLEGRLREQANRAPSQGRVHWWGYRDDVHQFLQHAYVYVQPSVPSLFGESFGRGVAEAMSMGVPSVCFASGVLSELVTDGETGLVCKEETTSALAQALARFLGDPDFRNACGQRARQRYQDEYCEAVVHSRWLEFIDAVA